MTRAPVPLAQHDAEFLDWVDTIERRLGHPEALVQANRARNEALIRDTLSYRLRELEASWREITGNPMARAIFAVWIIGVALIVAAFR